MSAPDLDGLYDERDGKIYEAVGAVNVGRLSPHQIVGGDHGMADLSLSKRCTKCGVVKSYDAFFRTAFGRAGVRPACKQCMQAVVTASRAKDKELWRAYGRASYWSHPVDRRFKAARYRNSEHGNAKRKAYCNSAEGKARIKAWREANKHVKNLNSKIYRHRHAKRLAILGLARKFNISQEYAAELLQRRTCDLCGATGRRMHTDHDHQRGVVRGRLCGPCNQALGMFDDDPMKLRLAIKYLLSARAIHANAG